VSQCGLPSPPTSGSDSQRDIICGVGRARNSRDPVDHKSTWSNCDPFMDHVILTLVLIFHRSPSANFLVIIQNPHKLFFKRTSSLTRRVVNFFGFEQFSSIVLIQERIIFSPIFWLMRSNHISLDLLDEFFIRHRGIFIFGDFDDTFDDEFTLLVGQQGWRTIARRGRGSWWQLCRLVHFAAYFAVQPLRCRKR